MGYALILGTRNVYFSLSTDQRNRHQKQKYKKGKLLPCTFLAGNNYLAKTSLPFLTHFSLPSPFLLLANVIMLCSLYMLTFEDPFPRALNQPVRIPHSVGTYLGQQQYIHLVSSAGGEGPVLAAL